jgi:glutathione peroxidase
MYGCTPKPQSVGMADTSTDLMTSGTIYAFKVEDIEGKEFDLASLRGKKVMIVNTASECGNTPQYKDLQMLYEKYGPEKFTIIGFPANNFGAQEPGTNEEIAAFCDKNYAITFPMMSKISVKGPDMHPLYRFLTQRAQNGYTDNEVKWNFQKYLINENGQLEKIIDEGTSPTDPEVISWIED